MAANTCMGHFLGGGGGWLLHLVVVVVGVSVVLVSACGTPSGYPTSLSPGFSFSRSADDDDTSKLSSQSGPVLLSSPNSTFLLCMTSCSLLIVHNDSGVVDTPVWSVPFPSCSADSTYTLSFTHDGNFVVSSKKSSRSGSSQVWSSQTSGRGVQSLQLLDSGNLVLLNAQNVVIWQSFDRPDSVLLAGQRLQQGTSLTLSDDLLSHINYSLTVEPDRAVLYATDQIERRPYWQLRPSSPNSTVAYAALDKGNLQLFDSNSNPLVANQRVINQTLVNSNPLWRAQLTATEVGPAGVKHGGNFEIHYWSMSDGSWRLYSQALTNLCDFPDACTHYGTCDPGNQQCTCRSPLVTSSSAGCDLPRSTKRTGLEDNFCSSARFPKQVRFFQLTNTSYFPLQYGALSFNVSYIECKSYCLQNCSCAAFVYRDDQTLCYPIHEGSDASTLSFVSQNDGESSVYVRTSSGISSLIAGVTAWALILSSVVITLHSFSLL